MPRGAAGALGGDMLPLVFMATMLVGPPVLGGLVGLQRRVFQPRTCRECDEALAQHVAEAGRRR